MGTYSPILTNAGAEAIAAARASGTEIEYTAVAVGDANGVSYTPSATQTALVHQVWSGAVDSVYVHLNNANWVVAECRIPSTVGGFEIREAAIYAGSTMISVSRYPTTVKPAPGSGSEKDLLVRFIFQVTSAAEVTHVIDPSLMYATTEYVDARLHHVRCATTANILLSGVQTIDGVVLTAGQRVLVRAQTDATVNGIYAVSTDAWTRTLDFNDVNNIIPTALVLVSEGTAYKDSLWMLTNDTITVGTTSLSFVRLFPDESVRTIADTETPTADSGTPTKLWSWLANMIKAITGGATWRTAPATTLAAAKAHIDASNPHTGSAPLASPALTGSPTAPTANADDDSTKLATTAWVRSAMSAIMTALGFAYSFGASGYIKFPSCLGGLILQWVSVSGTANISINPPQYYYTSANAVFPLSFPNSCLAVIAASKDVAGSGFVRTATPTQNSVTLTIFNSVINTTVTATAWAVGH